jgi:translation initiation factor 2 alpha subunit (eIF-2alpha)
MFYYSSNMPIEGQIVIGYLVPDKEEENCLYVRVPEYNNIEGIIPKSNLPKKKRNFKKILAQMKKDKIIPCLVKSEPRKDSNNQLWPLDLTLRNIEREKKQLIIDRFNNITRILRVFKFISEETKISFEELSLGLHKQFVTELEVDNLADNLADNSDDDNSDDDNSDNSNNLESKSDSDKSSQCLTDLSDLHQKIIGNHDFLIETIRAEYNLTNDEEILIRKTMSNNTVAKNSDCNIFFEFRVDDAKDPLNPVEVLQSTFVNIFDAIPNISIQYRGAPNYVATVQDVLPHDLENTISKLSQVFEDYLSELDPKPKYHLQFSREQSIAKEPIYTFSFPREVKMD